jgi:hypothetical protein
VRGTEGENRTNRPSGPYMNTAVSRHANAVETFPSATSLPGLTAWEASGAQHDPDLMTRGVTTQPLELSTKLDTSVGASQSRDRVGV